MQKAWWSLVPPLAPELGICPLYHHHPCLEWDPLKALSFRKFLPELTQEKAVVSLLEPLDIWGCFLFVMTGGYGGI